MTAIVRRPALTCELCMTPLALWETRCFRCGSLTALGRAENVWNYESPEDYRFTDDDQEEPRDAYRTTHD